MVFLQPYQGWKTCQLQTEEKTVSGSLLYNQVGNHRDSVMLFYQILFFWIQCEKWENGQGNSYLPDGSVLAFKYV